MLINMSIYQELSKYYKLLIANLDKLKETVSLSDIDKFKKESLNLSIQGLDICLKDLREIILGLSKYNVDL